MIRRRNPVNWSYNVHPPFKNGNKYFTQRMCFSIVTAQLQHNYALLFPLSSLKVAGSIPEVVIGTFHWHNPSGRTMALGSNQPSSKMNTRNILYFVGGKGGRCVGLTTLPHSCADCLDIWEPQTLGTLRACPDLYRDCFSFFTFPLLTTSLKISF